MASWTDGKNHACSCSRDACDYTCQVYADRKNRELNQAIPALDIASDCMICGNSFPVTRDYYIPSICPECKARLFKLLYPEGV